MICLSCRSAGQENLEDSYKKAKALHKKCKGDCSCQHKTGPGWTKREGTKVPLMQIQSP
jgi:hypothetical protein